jgi:hypothetical protein
MMITIMRQSSGGRTLFLAIALACAVASTAARGQSADGGAARASPKPRPVAKRPPELEAFATEAESAPPELAADALLRLAASPRAADPTWKRELIERAYVVAAGARAPVRRKAAPIVGRSVDNSPGYLEHAYGLGLDALSLRARAVRAMLQLDPARAKELFEQMPADLRLARLTCADATVYDVADFYALAGEVALKSFAPSEVASGARARFALRYIEAVSSPAQAAPAVRLVLAAGRRAEDTTPLARAVIKALRNLPADDRSFTDAVSDNSVSLFEAMGDLSRALAGRNDGLTRDLTEAYRKFLLAGMTAERCADDVPRRAPPFLSLANDRFFGSSPLKAEELVPAAVGPRADVREYWQTPGAQKLIDDYQDLRFDDDSEADAKDGVLARRRDTGTPEWEARLRHFLSELESWDGPDEASRLDRFNQQQVLYLGLREITPPGQARSEMLASWLKSLGGARDGDEEMMRYFFATELLKVVAASPPAERDDLLARISYSGDAVLSVMAKEARLKL